MVSVGTHTCKSANVADHVSDMSKYYTVSTCGHSQIHMCTCMEVIIRRSWEERYTWDNLFSANSSSSRPRIMSRRRKER